MIVFRDNRWTHVPSNPASRLVDRLPAFVADLSAADRGPARAVLEVAATFTSLLARRLERAPDKSRLAFLDAIGVEPIPAQPARCPVVFEMTPGTAHARAPERTQLGAPSSDGTIVYETESAIGLAASRLSEVVAVLPGNRYVDHTLDVVGEKPFVLFSGNQPIPQEMYLAHATFFAVTPGTLIELQFELAPTTSLSPGPWNLKWEYWDGDGWTPFAPFQTKTPAPESDATANQQSDAQAGEVEEYSEDGTECLTRSGTIRLRASGKPAEQTSIRGIKSYWIQSRVIPEDQSNGIVRRAPSGGVPPAVDRIQARSVSAVSGFELRKRTETLPAGGIMNRHLRIRLTDDSGAPLLVALPVVKGSSFGYTLTDRHGATITIDRRNASSDDAGLFVVNSTAVGEISLRVHWGELNASGQLIEPGIHTWDMPLIGDLKPDRSYDIDLARCGRLPTIAFGCGIKVDPTAVFQPFGPIPQPGATFLFASPEVFTKPGARVTVFTEVASDFRAASPSVETLIVRWEYWNGTVWAPLPDQKVEPKHLLNDVLSFVQSGEIQFTIPSNMAMKQELGQDQLWIRAHLAGGSYLVKNAGSASAGSNAQSQQETATQQLVTFDKVFPPVIQKLRIEYTYMSPAEPPSQCLTQSDFHWSDRTTAAAFGGNAFIPFLASEDVRPALYLGFSRALPTDLISLFVNVTFTRAESDLAWEYHDGISWRRLVLELDETDGLSQPGIVRFVWPGTPSLPAPEPLTEADGKTLAFLDARVAARFREGDLVAVFQDDMAESATVAAAGNGILTLQAPLENKFSAAIAGFSPLPRFGKPRYWVRIVWQQSSVPKPGDPDAFQVSGLYLNAVMAQQTKSITNELVGSSSGTDGETFDFANRPVLRSERVEILELSGPLANSGWAALLEELKRSGIAEPEKDLRLDRDEKTGNVIRAWVRWEGRPNFAGSGPDDRHYLIERTRSKLQFGDGQTGRVPPVNPNNIRVSYQSGGGRNGNVAARAVNVVMSGTTAAEAVFNPIAASGGADGEMMSKNPQEGIAAIADRGPQLIRHRHRAITAEDYEQLARAASPGVAAARVVTSAATRGLVRAGSIQVVILPHSDVSDPEPKPSDELIRAVRSFLQSRAPASLAGRVIIKRPEYFRVGVDTVLVPTSPDSAGSLFRLAATAIAKYLHPVAGGPEGMGWGFAEAVHRSDLVKYLHNDDGLKPYLAFVQELRLLDSGVAVPEELAIPSGQVPCAGAIRVIVDSETEARR